MSAPVSPSSFTPRVAAITGSSQGIGRQIALRLADDGLDIALNDIPSKSDAGQHLVDEIKAKGRNAIFVPGDVTSEDDVKNFINTTVEKLGSLDVVSIFRLTYLCCSIR